MTDESPTEFVVEVKGVGQFTFAKRNMRLEIKAAVELRRLTEGVDLDDFTLTFLRATAELKALTKSAPKGWAPEELDDLDPYDDATYGRVLLVWGALREKERPFRGAAAGVQAGGQDAGGDGGSLVPPNLQSGAD
jgi:hypothetical protein